MKNGTLRVQAHDIATMVWDWNNKRSRRAMYRWIARNKERYGGEFHIGKMGKSALKTLIADLQALSFQVHDRPKYRATPANKRSGDRSYLKHRPWVRASR